jgi:hypothetical protein|uniref:Uncharacterized protein n=1 Tax=Oryza sativa subsp. japonica TaxID=39947 RepID=Q5TKP4_ORYSJ|nr:unknown protein [Oryza sativa Japonica Group]
MQKFYIHVSKYPLSLFGWDVDQAGLPGGVPDGGERALRGGGAGRRAGGDQVAGVQDQPEGVRAVRRRRGGGHAVRVPGGRRRHRRVLGEERPAARRRRPARRAAAAGDHVREGAQARAHGVPLGPATLRASAAAAGASATSQQLCTLTEWQNFLELPLVRNSQCKIISLTGSHSLP